MHRVEREAEAQEEEKAGEATDSRILLELPPKKAKKNTLAAKKRYASQAKNDQKPVNLLISILHAHEKKEKTSKALGNKKKSGGSNKRGISLPLNM